MNFKVGEILRRERYARILSVLCLVAAAGGASAFEGMGYVGEIRLYATSFCPSYPRSEDVTGRPGVGPAPVPGTRYCKSLGGLHPSDGGNQSFIAQIRRIEAPRCPNNYLETDGRLLAGNEHMPLYALLGITFGGDYRKSVFALPQLAPNPDGSRYCLADRGVFPPREGGYVDSHIGEIIMTAANYCPGGSFEADGRELPSYQYQALSYLLGNSFGGRYPDSFRVPDLRKFAPPNIKYCLVLNGEFPPRQ